ncbi:MAG TPA: MFS transporter, partial [Streptomyces sp.]|nr:MFS transporter [Streptomyces sp.]
PPMGSEQAAQLEGAAEVGIVPPAPQGTPDQMVQAITDVVHGSFVSGMSLAFTCAGIVAALAAGVAVFTKRGDNAEAAGGAAHI